MVNPNSSLAEFDNQLVGEMRQERKPEPEPDHFFKWLGRTELAQGTKEKIVDLLSQEKKLESDWAKEGANLYADVLNLIKIDQGDWSGKTIEEIQNLEEGEKSLKALLWPAALAVKGGQKVTDFLIPDSYVETAEKASRGETFTKGEALAASLPILEVATGAGLAAPFIKKGGSTIIKTATKGDEIKSVAQGGKFGEMSDDFVNYYANIAKQGHKEKFLKLHDRINEFFQTPRKITDNPYEGLGLKKTDIENFISKMKGQQWFKNKNVQDNWASWRAEKQARSGSSQLLAENTENTIKNFEELLSKKSEKELLELQDNVTGSIQLHGIFNEAFEKAFGHAPAYTGGTGFGHLKTYKVIRELNKRLNLSIPESRKMAMMPINQADINKLPIGSKLSSDQARRYLRNLSEWKTQSTTDKLFNKNVNLSKIRDDIDNLLIEGKRPYEFDHIQSFIFGGGNDIDNISVLLVREHRGTQIPIKEGLDVIKSKTKFEQNIHKKYMNIIDEVKKGNVEEATKIANQVNEFVSNTIANKPSYSFIIDQPYTPRKLAQEGSNRLAYVNEIDYLVKQGDLTIDKANQIKSLIKRVEYKPDYAKVFRSGEEGFVDKMQSAYNTLKDHAGAKRVDIKTLSRKNGGMVQSMKDGGIVQYFKDGTDQEGVTADQGSISGIDVKPYIPPHLRMSEDKLTVGDIGTGISEAAETMWPYMVPGVGEYLSAKDYEMFSQQAEEAWGKGEYPSWLGATILGSVALGGTVPNWTVVGAVPNLALGAYKGIKKAITPTPTKIAKKPIVEMEKRYVIKDEAGNKVFQAKSIDDAEQKVLVLKDKEGKNFTIEEINIPKKVKKTKQEVVHVPTVTATDVIGSGDHRLFYSKMDQYMQGTNGNIRVKIGGSGSSVDIPINEAKLSAKEWHDSFRAAGVKESELVDSYIRQYLNKKGVFKDGKFTNNQPIAYAEIKELFDGSPSRFVQSSKYSDADGNLKYGDGGRAKGYKDGTREEHVLWMDSKDIRGDVQELPSNIARYEGHRDIRKVETDVNFSTNNKLEGEPYVIGWSLVDDRPGILANKKNVTVTTATEIQSDFLQKAASLKANLKKDLKTNIQAGNTSTVKEITQKLENIFRQMPLTSAEIKSYTSQIEQASKVFDDVAKMDLNLVDDAVMRQLDEAAALRDEALAGLNKFIDDIDPKDLFPNIPFKDQKDWVSSLIKNDVAIAAQKRFYFDENGVLQVNKNAPSHYSVAPSVTQKNRWMQSSMRDNPDIGMNTPPNMRSTREHGQAVAYDLEYGGPQVYAPDTWQVIDESKIIKDIDGKIVRYEDGYVVSKGHPRIVSAEGVLNKMVDDGLSIENIKIEKVKTHFTSNSEATLRKIASEKNAEFSIGKVKHGNEMVESYLIELTPEMLTPFAQYFKHGGLVEKIPQYNPLKSVLDVIGPIGAY